MSKLKSEFWVKAYLKRLSLEGISGFVVHHGDNDAGDLLITVCNLEGAAKHFQREYNFEADKMLWKCIFSGNQEDGDALAKKKLKVDPDLWVLEIEDPQGRHFLEDNF